MRLTARGVAAPVTTTAYPTVTVYESRTHLVEDDCLDNPDGPGC